MKGHGEDLLDHCGGDQSVQGFDTAGFGAHGRWVSTGFKRERARVGYTVLHALRPGEQDEPR